MALGQHTWSDYVGRGRLSSPLGSINRIGQCWAWHAIIDLGKHIWSDNVRHGILLSPLDITHDRTTLGVACYHRPLTTHIIELRRFMHEIMALGQNTRSDDIGRGMLLSIMVIAFKLI